MKSSTIRSLVFGLALATVLAVGATTTWMMAANWLIAIAQQMLSPRQPNENLVFTADGSPLIQATNYSTNTTVTRTVDGKPVEDLDKLEVVHSGGWMGTPRLRYLRRWRTRIDDWRTRVSGYLEPGGAPNFWYLIRDTERFPYSYYFEGFDAKTRTRIGYIGIQGFRSDEPPLDERFLVDEKLMNFWGGTAGIWGNSGEQPYSYSWSPGQPTMLFMICAEKLYRVDLKRRIVEMVPIEGAVLAVADARQPMRIAGQKELISKLRICVRLEDRVLVLDESGATLRTLLLPEATRERMLSIFLTAGDQPIVVAMGDPYHAMTDIYWLNAAGEVERSEPIQLERISFWFLDQPIWQAALATPTVLALAWTTHDNARKSVDFGQFDDYAEGLAHALRGNWPWFAAIGALSLALAVICFRRQARLAQSHPAVWAGFVLVGGPAAFVGYLLHRHWPATTRCAKCGSVVPYDRFECAACAAQFALPAERGFEIFV